MLLGLNIAEGFDIGAMGAQSADRHHHLIECARLALTDGMYHITDPARMRMDTGRLISKSYAAARRRFIREQHAMDNVPRGVKPEDGDTVYITCVDGEGNACSLINSVFSDFGTGLVVPGTGIALAQPRRFVLAQPQPSKRACAQEAAVPHSHSGHCDEK